MIKRTGIYFIVIILSILTTINLYCQNCFDYTNLYDTSLVTCYYGNYSNPYASIGVIPNRHYIKTDISEKDTLTNNLLSCVPPGETTSVRLGNSLSGSQAESIKYTFYVDTNDFEILILKYAIVMQNPNHNLYNQPRFRLEILNSNDQIIDSVCGFANFISSGSLGWNNSSGNVLWKDWTTIGLDISNYNNQIVKVRLTTYDCNFGAHFGYAYFNLKCSKRELKQITCGDTNIIAFQAPIGFNYSWSSVSNPSEVLSTSRELIVPSNNYNETYTCKCSFLENSNCYFNVSINSQEQYPIANFNYSFNPCTKKVSFINQSIISNFDSTISGNVTCEDIKWVFPNNTISNSINPVVTYDSAGVYPVMLIAYINGQCNDTIIKNIILDDSLFYKVEVSNDTTICSGNSLVLSVNHFESYLWDVGDTTQSITVFPTTSRNYNVTVIDKYNCRWNDIIRVNVNPRYNITYEATICEDSKYSLHGFNDSIEGFYTHNFTTIKGCDSIINLDLQVKSLYNDTIQAKICSNQTYNLFGFNENKEGLYVHNNSSIYGCDSTISLNLIVNKSYLDTIEALICENETYDLYGFIENVEGLYTHSYTTNKGCDSVVCLNLKVKPIYNDTIQAEICNNKTYNLFGFNESQEGLYVHNNSSIYGCDSVLYLNLRVNLTYYDTINAEICDNKPYNLFGFNENVEGFYTHSFQTLKGCDSILNLSLIVHKSIDNYSLIENKYVVAEHFPIIIDVSCEDCYNYVWNTGAIDSIFYINNIGNYYVTIGHRCGNIYDSIVVLYPEVNVFLPNAFTPNENSNNTFFPVFDSNEKLIIESFEIYNRWGKIIYSSKNKAWDGRYNGKLCDSGVYVWRLLYKTKYTGINIFEKTGEINLIR